MTYDDWFWLVLISVNGASFLFGRWRGIKDFERQMVEAGLLPTSDEDKLND